MNYSRLLNFSFHSKLMTLLGIHFIILIYTITNNFDWKLLFLGWIISKVFNAIGNEAALHRLWAHKSYKTDKWKEYILHCFAIPLLYGTSITYAGVHRQHHAYADTDKDPHITRPWWKVCFYVRNNNYAIETKFVKDLIKDPMHRFLHNYYFVINSFILLLSIIILGMHLTGYILSFLVIYNFIAAGLVNVLGHRPEYGSRPYKTNDHSSNNKFLKWLTWNEGYHNYHHYNSNDWNYARKPGEFDFPALIIKYFLMK